MASYARSQSRRERRSPRTGSSRRSSFADRRRREDVPEALLRGVELLTTVTPLRPEDVTGHTLGVETDEDIALPRHLTFHEGHVLFAREGAHECVDPEVSIAGR